MPRERSRAPGGTTSAAGAGSGGRSQMLVPRRGSLTTTPRRRSSAIAAATVAGLRPAPAARRRTDGSRSPAVNPPVATADSTSVTSAAAVFAFVVYCFSADT